MADEPVGGVLEHDTAVLQPGSSKVERRSYKPEVVGSSPSQATSFVKLRSSYRGCLVVPAS